MSVALKVVDVRGDENGEGGVKKCDFGCPLHEKP